jgi:hypothetical protein
VGKAENTEEKAIELSRGEAQGKNGMPIVGFGKTTLVNSYWGKKVCLEIINLAEPGSLDFRLT